MTTLRYKQSGTTSLMVFVVLFVLGVVGGTGWLVYARGQKPLQDRVITNFQECVAAGNPVMESFPERCSAGGKTFTNNVKN